MLDSPEDLLRKIRLGEDGFLELKEVMFAGERMKAPGRDQLADELAAFANGRGGGLVLGVDDATREIVGIPMDRLDAAERYVSEIVRDSINPPLYPLIERLELPDTGGTPRPVLRVEVSPSLFVHESSGGYLHRVGSSKRRMEPDYLFRLQQQRSQSRLIRFDEMPVHEASFADLDGTLVDRFALDGVQDDRETLACKLGMAARSDRRGLRPTVTGVLLGAFQPVEWLPHAYVQAVAYRGRSVPESLESPWYQLDASDFTGPVDRQITDACLFVARNQKVRAKKTMGRVDQPQYDMTAVLEAVVNAVAHRDYSMHGARIRLHMFSDRIELYSPGTLLNSMTVDDLPYRQTSRNETLTSLLSRCPIPVEVPGLETPRTTLMDRRGNGVLVIYSRSERLSGKRPTYEMFGESELRLTIYAASDDEDDTSPPAEMNGDGVA